MFRNLSAAILAILVSISAQADITQDTLLDVTIEDALVMTDQDGVHRLKFRLVNNSPERITITAITSPAARNIELTYNSHHGEKSAVSDLTILPDEETDFSTSHLQARLVGASLDDGNVPFVIFLQKGSVEGEADVH